MPFEFSVMPLYDAVMALCDAEKALFVNVVFSKFVLLPRKRGNQRKLEKISILFSG